MERQVNILTHLPVIILVLVLRGISSTAGSTVESHRSPVEVLLRPVEVLLRPVSMLTAASATSMKLFVCLTLLLPAKPGNNCGS